MAIIRPAAAHDLARIEEIYDAIHTAEEAGHVSIRGVRGVYPPRATAQGLTGDTQDAADATGSLADATADAAEDAKTAGQAWDEYLQSLDAIVDAAFQFTNAEAGMYSALDELNQSLYDNGNSFDTFTEAGRSNLEALQNYLKATAQYAGRMAEEMGMSGVEAQEYIASYVQAAIDDLKAQGIDTTWVEAQMSNVVSSLDQTISGPTVDMSALNAGLQDAVTNANNAAALIQQILAGVGIRTSSRPGGGLNTGGKRLNKNVLGSKGGLTTKQITAGMSIGAMGFTGGGGSARGLANTMFQGNKQRYQFTPKTSSSGHGGGGGGGHRGGGGGGGGAAVLIGVGAAAAITAGVIMMSPVEIKGRVVLADQAAVPGAKISLLREGKVVAQTTADENGSFSLKAKRGSYELTAAYTTADGQLIYKIIDIKAPAKDLTVTF